jgi:hypothetical protein
VTRLLALLAFIVSAVIFWLVVAGAVADTPTLDAAGWALIATGAVFYVLGSGVSVNLPQ